MTKKFLLAAPLALLSAALVASPAAAASWSNPGEIRSDIAQLDRQIDRAQRNGDLTRNEAGQLRGQVDNLQALYARYARGGLDRGEIRTLSSRVDQVQNRLIAASNDRQRRGDHRYDDRRFDDHRDGRYDRH